MRILLVILLIISYLPVLAQSYASPKGARAGGMANAVVTLQDAWALGNNIGALAGIEKPTMAFAYYNPFLISGLQTVSLVFVSPIRTNTAFGLGIQNMGESLFRETQISAGISQKMGIASLGLKINYLQYWFEGLGTRNLLTFEFGGVAQFSEKIWVGAHILNFTQAQVANFQDEKYPVVMKTGLSYRPSTKLMLNLETEKDIDRKAVVRFGMEYFFLKNVAFRAGVRSFPFSQSAGLRFKLYQIEIDYGLQTHPQLSPSQFLSLNYIFEKKKKAVK